MILKNSKTGENKELAFSLHEITDQCLDNWVSKLVANTLIQTLQQAPRTKIYIDTNEEKTIIDISLKYQVPSFYTSWIAAEKLP